jgi:hypothetical protein
MSTVISFRLDRNNPREAQALLVLVRWQEEGYSIRHIMTEALIRLEESDTKPDTHLADILAALQAISQQIGQLEARSTYPGRTTPEPQAALSDAFLIAVKGAARPGVKMEG